MIPKQSIDIQPNQMTRHRLSADIEYLDRLSVGAAEDGSLAVATILRTVQNDLKDLVENYIYFNERGTALKKIKEVDELCQYGETTDSTSSSVKD